MQAAEYSIQLAEALYNETMLRRVFELGKTERPGTPYCVISHATLKERGMLKEKVVFKTYRRVNDTPASKVAQRTYREVKAYALLANSLRRCDYINRFHGVWFFEDPKEMPDAVPGIPSIVTDYVKYGSLEYIEGRNFRVRLNLVLQLASGISFMHSLNAVHGDIKPDNFRVTEDGIVKIIDFGLSRQETFEHTGFTTIIHPSYLFLAPELIVAEEDGVPMSVTKASDAYAFSMTALQVLDGSGNDSRPFNHCLGPYPVRYAIINNQWPQAQRYPGVVRRAWEIISACWTHDPSVRPSVDALLEGLSGVSYL